MPGVTVNVVDAPASAGLAADASKWLVVGRAQKGSSSAYEVVHSLSEFVTKLGTRQSYSYLYDSAETFFREGGGTLIVGRVVGPAALPAAHTFNDGSAGVALVVKANSPGDWGNGSSGGLAVAITHPTTGFAYQVSLNGAVVESSPEFATISDAILWASHNSSYVVLSDPGAVALPAVITATNLTAGTEDSGSIVTASWQSALDRLVSALGPGQVSCPGTSTTAIQQAVINHATDHNRVAVLDGPNSILSTDFSTQVSGLTGEGRKHACLAGPWAVIPGITADTVRQVPYSAVLAGIIARNDGPGDLPNVDTAPAGDAGYSRFAVDLTVHWDKATRDTLNTAGVIPARVSPVDGRVQTYGDRTLASITSQRPWLELSSARLFMFVVAEGKAIGETFVFKPLDSALRTVNRFGQELVAFLMRLQAAGMINNDPQTAVDVLSVNTTTTKANRQLVANITVLPAEAAEDVVLNVAAQAA